MIKLIYDRRQKSITIPGEWNELTTSQYLKIVKLLHSGIDDEDIGLDNVLFILSNKSLYAFLRIPVDIRQRCYEHIQWVFSKQNITEQLLPTYKGLHGPASEFDNLLMAEFHHCEMAYHRLVNAEENEDAMNELVAILYREGKKKPYDIKRNPDGDLRITFSHADIEWHKKKVKRWKLHVKQAVVMWYDGCRELLRQCYPEAFAKGEGTTANYYDGLFGMIRNIAGGKYGDFEKVESMYVHTAFKEMVETIIENREMEERIKEMSK